MAIILETRTLGTEFEFRESTGPPVLEGYAATFNQVYDLGAFREVIDPEAFVRTLASEPDVRLLVDHEGQALARTSRPGKPGTMELSTDSQGLHLRTELEPSDPDVQRLLPKLRRGDLDQMSFGFRVPRGGDTWDDDLRTLREISLAGGDVSVVTYPANQNTSVTLRSRDVRDAQCVFIQHVVEEIRAGQSISDENLTRLRDLLAELTTDPEDPPAEPALAVLPEPVVEIIPTRSLRSALAYAAALSL